MCTIIATVVTLQAQFTIIQLIMQGGVGDKQPRCSFDCFRDYSADFYGG